MQGDATLYLEGRVENLRRDVEGMRLENEILERYLARHTSAADPEGGPAARPRKQRHRQLPTALTTKQKLEVVNSELEELGKEGDVEDQESEKLVNTLRAFLEQSDLRVTELRRSAYEFKRDVVVGAENPRTGKIMAERVLRYMEDKLRQRDGMTEKLRLKNATLRSQITKMETQLRQKEEMGDVLHYIDFHQLQIENKQFQQRIEERNEELLRLKMTTGRTFQSLNSHKAHLHEVTEAEERLEKEIASQTETLARIRGENVTIANEIQAERRARKRMSNMQAETGGAPQVLDYVNQKREYYDLQEELRNWERKMEIMNQACRTAKGKVRTLRRSTRQAQA